VLAGRLGGLHAADRRAHISYIKHEAAGSMGINRHHGALQVLSRVRGILPGLERPTLEPS
jgi:hypothetical protein